MTVKMVQIGNSKGIRIPKAIREQVGLGDKVNLRVEGRHLIIESTANPRAGWAEAFAKGGSPELTDEDKAWINFPNKFDKEEWTW